MHDSTRKLVAGWNMLSTERRRPFIFALLCGLLAARVLPGPGVAQVFLRQAGSGEESQQFTLAANDPRLPQILAGIEAAGVPQYQLRPAAFYTAQWEAEVADFYAAQAVEPQPTFASATRTTQVTQASFELPGLAASGNAGQPAMELDERDAESRARWVNYWSDRKLAAQQQAEQLEASPTVPAIFAQLRVGPTQSQPRATWVVMFICCLAGLGYLAAERLLPQERARLVMRSQHQVVVPRQWIGKRWPIVDWRQVSRPQWTELTMAAATIGLLIF
ncbi:hypothetical protein SH139x_003895 [Planctomycetaceae bacterium SH139]